MAPKPGPARLAFVFGKESRILQPVSPVLVAFSAILLTSVVLLAVDSFINTEALAFIYLRSRDKAAKVAPHRLVVAAEKIA